MQIAEKIGKHKKDNGITILQVNRWDEILNKRLAYGKALKLKQRVYRKIAGNITWRIYPQTNRDHEQRRCCRLKPGTFNTRLNRMQCNRIILISKADKTVSGTIQLTGSKSECNRALIIEALSKGKVKVRNMFLMLQTRLHLQEFCVTE